MYSKAKISGHPIHPMLVAFPITFYVLTVVSFGVYQFFSADAFWYQMGFFANMAAVVTALVAAVPGFIDWAFGVPRENISAKRDGLIHMVLNLVGVALFLGSAIWIMGTWNAPLESVGLPLVLTALGTGVSMVAGSYGWVMISRHKVGVEMDPDQARIQERREREARREPPMYH